MNSFKKKSCAALCVLMVATTPTVCVSMAFGEEHVFVKTTMDTPVTTSDDASDDFSDVTSFEASGEKSVDAATDLADDLAAGSSSSDVVGTSAGEPAASADKSLASPLIKTVNVAIDPAITSLEVPYGVDVETWINDKILFTNDAGLDATALKALFKNGKVLVVSSGGNPSAYPQPGDSLTLSWGVAAQTSQPVSGSSSSLARVQVTMGSVEPWLLDGISLNEPAEVSNARLTGITSAGQTPRLWTNGPLSLDGLSSEAIFVFASQAASVQTVPDPSAFAAASSSLNLLASDSYPRDVFVRVDTDCTFRKGTPQEKTLAKGQIVKLPRVCMDNALPQQGATAALSSSFMVDASVYAQALNISVSGQDDESTNAASVSLDDSVSGLARVVLKHQGQVVSTQTIAGGVRGLQQLTFGLPSPATYQTADLALELVDIAGNAVELPLASLVDQSGTPFGVAPVSLVLDTQKPSVSVSYLGTTSPSGCYRTRAAVVSVSDVHFDALRTWYLALSPAQQDALPPIMQFENTSLDASDPHRFVAVTMKDLMVSTAPGSVTVMFSGDGVYQVVSADMPPAYQSVIPGLGSTWAVTSDLSPFTLDATAPTSAEVTFAANGTVDGECAFYAADTTLDIVLKDALSGIDPTSATLTLNGVDQTVSLQSIDTFQSVLTWHIPAEAVYIDLAQVEITFQDNAGNRTVVKDLAAYANKSENASGLFVSDVQPELAISFDNNDARNEKYYNASRIATLTLRDPAFSFVAQLHPERVIGAGSYQGKTLNTAAKEFKPSQDDPAVWTATVECSEDGAYMLEAAYTCPTGLSAEDVSSGEFVVDTLAPLVVGASLSPENNLQGGRLFAADAAYVTFSLTDATSGVDDATATLAERAQEQKLPCVVENADALSATATWTMPAENRMIELPSIAFSCADRAGNVAYVHNLDAFERRNLKDVHQVFVDTETPEIQVSYDNNDVRNGSYYNANRTATITLREASFMYVQESDPQRVLATLHQGEGQRVVRAEDFENLTGDGVTWTASIVCDSDAVYQLEAAFTDFSGKEASSYGEQPFTVDKTNPLIMVTFDNNNAQSGQYYKAPRTASVTLYETNFSADLASVATSATTSDGSAVAAPGIGGWAEMPAGTWRSSVYFGEELHYSLEAACTDLAGNTAKTVTVPEFIIDMTPPQLTVSRVANGVAYKDEVAPLVQFQDTNFEPYLADVSIVGASGQNTRYFKVDDEKTDTERTLNYADFDYTITNDDVYTLAATVRDKAGNEVQQHVVFSVNRYGSNYVLSDETRPLMGAFVKKGQDVVVTEINVSGLAESAVNLVRNDAVEPLLAGEDYTVQAEGDQSSWSRYVYTLPAKLFEEDGYYRVLLNSTDIAGGFSENLMQGKNEDRTGALEIAFAVDGTSPQALLGNIDQKSSYYAPARRVDVYVDDNLQADQASLFVNNAQVASWNADELADADARTYELPASTQAQTVRLEVRDRAGNIMVVSTADVVVTDDLIRYVLETPALLYPLIAAVVIVVAGLAMGTTYAIERRRRKEIAND